MQESLFLITTAPGISRNTYRPVSDNFELILHFPPLKRKLHIVKNENI